jgi:porin-like protein
MTTVKSFFLASAASFVTIAAAQAADLPVKAKPVEYVRICSLYGDGFYYIPGTDTCIKLGGYLRAEVDVNAAGTLTPAVGPGSTNNRDNINNRESQSMVQRTRMLWTLDTRTQTEYGTLRSYARTGIQWSSGDSVNSGSNAVAYIDRAFLQFAGFTAGRAVSFFDIYSFSLHSFQTNVIGSDSGGTGINLFAWTTEFGNGLSASISAEEHSSRSKPVVNTIGTAGFLNLNNNAAGAPANLGTGTFTSQAGDTIPNLVANVRLDQAWGAVQASAAASKVSATYYSTSTAAAGGGGALALGGGAGGLETLGHPDDKWGFAGTVGTVINLPWAKGDTFGLQYVYSQGATAYAGQGQGTFNVVNGNNLGVGFATDAVYGAQGTNLELTTAWSLTAGAQHYWSPKWRTSLYGGFENISYNPNATAMICGGLAAGGAGSAASAGGFTPSNCKPDFSFWQIGSRTIWNPVPSLDLGVEILYNRINTAFAGPVSVSANGTIPAGPFTASDQGVVSAVFRAQRNFLP